jgi:hypothetical protein
MRREKLGRCSHGHGRRLCFECFRAGSERTRARQEAWAQRALPFDGSSESGASAATTRRLSDQEIAHRKQMLAYLESAARRRA